MNGFIHGSFVAAAARYPDNPAIWSEDGTMSYGDLDQRSSALSRWLLMNDLAPKKRTAIILPKGNEAVITIIAILKAGNAYVPLGAGWSEGRLDKIIQNGDFSLIIAESENLALDYTKTQFLFTQSELWNSCLEDNSEGIDSVETSPEDLAYILYTSGSTGIPKGVCVSHRAASYFPNWATHEFELSGQDRVASIAPFSFDLSTFDLFSGLSVGATIYLVPEKYKLLPGRFSKFLQDHKITVMYAVPSMLGLLALKGKLDKRDLSSIETILFAGEVFPTPLFLQFRTLMPPTIQYCNLYGPTETNVCTYYRVPEEFNDKSMPIGIPLPGTHCFVHQIDVDNDSEGELCVSGPAVMSGYWGMNDADADFWLEDPTGNETRAYCTGDLVSLKNDGNWMYYGRTDKMVKIRGYRVEIGEIESCLLSHQDVDLAAVIKRTNREYLADELVAFIVPRSIETQAPDSDFDKLTQSIINHCKHNLPTYMIPRKVYQLASMPVNNSGKIDRLKLEEVALQGKNSGRERS